MYFEEKKDTPTEEKHRILIAHGFHKELVVQDFPLRGKNVFFHIKRRRWLDKTTRQAVHRNWDLVAQGTHEQSIQSTNKALRRNRSLLLAHFCPSGKSTVEKKVLVDLNFRFELFTNIFPFRTGIYFFCYDYGYLPIIEKRIEKMLIVQKQEYMDTLDFSPWEIQINKNK